MWKQKDTPSLSISRSRPVKTVLESHRAAWPHTISFNCCFTHWKGTVWFGIGPICFVVSKNHLYAINSTLYCSQFSLFDYKVHVLNTLINLLFLCCQQCLQCLSSTKFSLFKLPFAQFVRFLPNKWDELHVRIQALKWTIVFSRFSEWENVCKLWFTVDRHLHSHSPSSLQIGLIMFSCYANAGVLADTVCWKAVNGTIKHLFKIKRIMTRFSSAEMNDCGAWSLTCWWFQRFAGHSGGRVQFNI